MREHARGASLRYFYDFDGDGVDDFQARFCSQTSTYKKKTVDVLPSGNVSTTTSTLSPQTTWTVRGCAEPRDPKIVPQERKCGSEPDRGSRHDSPNVSVELS